MAFTNAEKQARWRARQKALIEQLRKQARTVEELQRKLKRMRAQNRELKARLKRIGTNEDCKP
jgi:hypothetical protein